MTIWKISNKNSNKYIISHTVYRSVSLCGPGDKVLEYRYKIILGNSLCIVYATMNYNFFSSSSPFNRVHRLQSQYNLFDQMFVTMTHQHLLIMLWNIRIHRLPYNIYNTRMVVRWVGHNPCIPLMRG
jgi:hypothetical protein